MKLLFIILRDTDGDKVIQAMVSQGFRVTRVASTGGFLRHGNLTLMCGVEDEKIPDVMTLLRKSCAPAEKDRNRATVFGVDMPLYEQI
jgi:uncharacterized protein YaaQ